MIGTLPNQTGVWTTNPFIDADEPVSMGGNGQAYSDLTDKVQVSVPVNDPKVAVIVVAGQSYGDNMPLTDPDWQDSIYTPTDNVVQLDVFNGNFYKAADPMLNLTGVGGTMWTRLGDDLIDSGQYNQIVVVPVDVGGSSINSWAPIDPTTGQPGTNLNKLQTALQDLQNVGLAPTQFIWEQGIADAPTMPPIQYQTEFNQLTDVLRGNGMNAPIYIATNSVAYGASSAQTAQSQAFAAAQQQETTTAASVPGVYQGVNFDNLPGSDYSIDGHFTTNGLNDAAQQWATILEAPLPAPFSIDKATLIDKDPVDFSTIQQLPDSGDGSYPIAPSLSDKLAASATPSLYPVDNFSGVTHFSS